MPGSPRDRARRAAALARLGVIPAVLWGAATIAFVAVKAIPGDPVAVLTGGENVVDAAERAALVARFGLDRPLPVQYAAYLGRALTGDFGESYQYRRPVLAVLAEAAGPTLQLAGSAMALALGLALASALATSGRGGPLRHMLSGLELAVLSTPVYWIGLMLLWPFGFTLGWFPVVGGEGLRGLVLPALALSLHQAALLAQVLRDGLEEALAQPFALTVRSRGVGETALRLRHALRHAALSAATLAGTLFAGLLAGSILTETVFGRPGIGQITVQAIRTRDMPLLLGLVMLSALAAVLVNLAVDALNRHLDPRLWRSAA